jgi:dipeptidyl aminopeptidase/acylaminoacyl peptidase
MFFRGAATTTAILISLILGLLLSCFGPEQELKVTTELIPREVVFGNPQRTDPQLSPDGTMLSYLAPVDTSLNVWVGTVGVDDAKPVTEDTLRGIYHYFWAADNEHLMYFQDVNGNENWRLYGKQLRTGEVKDYTPYERVQVRLVARDKNFPHEILIAMNQMDEHLHDVYRLNIETGELVLAAKNPGDAAGWVADANLEVRGMMLSTPDGGYDLMVRENQFSGWVKLLTWGHDDALTSRPIGFTKDGRHLYALDSRDNSTARLVKISVSGGHTKVLAEDPVYDVVDVIVNPNSYEIEAAIFAKDRQELVVLDSSIQEDIDAINALSDGDPFICSRDNADRLWLVGFEEDDGPRPYFYFDRSSKKAEHLFDQRPRLNEYTLAPMEPFSFTSRDSLTIHGYLTFPPNKERANLPMVLNVHGGPWNRDTWGYHPEAQWLANRGYLCMQVNFRGSTGYGKDFLNAGDREWGGKMHDDLIDAVDWAIDQGYADPSRVAIMGGSYGGYAALVGATFTPDVFCCAVEAMGVSNLLSFIHSIPPYWETFRAVLYRRIGDPREDEEFLKSLSPLFKADQIKIPMLIAQGANDVRVPKAQAEQIVAAMKENGVDYEYILFEDEGHMLMRAENRLKFYAAAEKFLAEHLGGRYEPAAGD